MNADEFKNKFLLVEKEKNLFFEKDSCGNYCWDIVRYKVYMALYKELVRKDTSNKNKKNSKYLSVALFVLYDFFYLCKLFLSKKKYIFFMVRREKNDFGLAVDPVMEEAYRLLINDSSVVDRVLMNKRGSYKNTIIKIFNLFKTKKVIPVNLNESFKESFHFSQDLNLLASSELSKFYSEKKFYSIFLKFSMPEVIFFVATANEKALLSAASEKGVKTIEFQHGQVNSYHPYYSYPKDLEAIHLTLPDCFLTFGEYWHKFNYPVGIKQVIGKSGFIDVYREDICEKSVLIISADVYQEDINKLIREMVLMDDLIEITLKLHPNESKEYQAIKSEYKAISNKVRVVLYEETVSSLLLKTDNIFLIQSTVVYEALQVNCRVFIYEKQDYYSHEDVFDHPNVQLFSEFNDIKGMLQKPVLVKERQDYFNKFDSDSFKTFVKNIIST